MSPLKSPLAFLPPRIRLGVGERASYRFFEFFTAQIRGLEKMFESIKNLFRRAQPKASAVSSIAYTTEQDGRVTSAIGPEGFEFSRRLEAAQRIDPDKFYEAIDTLIRNTPDELQKEYGR